MRILLIGVLLANLLVDIRSAFTPCNGKAQLGEDCDITADCENKGSICLRGKCRCHFNYVEATDSKSKTSRCERLPASIGERCESKCREPLFCRSGKCQCVQRGNTQVVNGECVLMSNVGDRCTRHYDCTTPFTACVNSHCVCISGAVQEGNKCVAVPHCPVGGAPRGSCVRSAQYQEEVENMGNSGGNADNCADGYYCVTPSDSPIGHCCPPVCPLGSTADPSYSCDPNTSASNRCPSDTHHCHRVAGPGYAFAACCRRPCNAIGPNAVYIKGDCVARGFLNSECSRHEQCDGIQTMFCANGSCQCKADFSPYTDALINPQKNPTQTCQKTCPDKKLSRDTECYQQVALNAQCFIQAQCPLNSGCYRGRCLCRCGYEERAGSCHKIPPPPTTTLPPGQSPVAVNGGTNDFLGIITKFLNAGGQGGSPNLNGLLGVGR